MKYKSETSTIFEIHRHLRNKNLTIVPKVGWIEKFLRLLSKIIWKCRFWRMKKYPPRIIVSEQIVEFPLIMRHLRREDKTILDFGGYESVLPLQLTALGYEVSVFDYRIYPFSHPNLHVFHGDLFDKGKQTPPRGGFDVVLSVSTIEHLGLGGYGDQIVEDADKKGVKILWGFVKKGGRLLATVPAGKPAIQRGYRVYDEERLREVFPMMTAVLWYMKSGREGTWRKAEGWEIKDLVYSEPLDEMPLEGVAFVMCVKKKAG